MSDETVLPTTNALGADGVKGMVRHMPEQEADPERFVVSDPIPNADREVTGTAACGCQYLAVTEAERRGGMVAVRRFCPACGSAADDGTDPGEADLLVSRKTWDHIWAVLGTMGEERDSYRDRHGSLVGVLRQMAAGTVSDPQAWAKQIVDGIDARLVPDSERPDKWHVVPDGWEVRFDHGFYCQCPEDRPASACTDANPFLVPIEDQVDWQTPCSHAIYHHGCQSCDYQDPEVSP